MPPITFQQAIADCAQSRRHVLLGNGFSMAYSRDMFSYASLFDTADIDNNYEELSEAFEVLETRDFEAVMHALQSAAAVGQIYGCQEDNVGQMVGNIEDLKNLLIEAISNTHPGAVNSIADPRYTRTRQFLAPFNNIFTTNYDLLLYWALQRNEDDVLVTRTDGFFREDGILTWDRGNQQTSYYLHGAMHLYKEDADIVKLEYQDIGNPLTDQVRDKIDDDLFPIFVSEGTATEKLIKIEENKYLTYCLNRLAEISGALFIHGHSFSGNDDHIWDTISDNKDINKLFVSIYGNENDPSNQAIIARANGIAAEAEATIQFYTSDSANLW